MEAKTDIITKEETILHFFLRKARLLVNIQRKIKPLLFSLKAKK